MNSKLKYLFQVSVIAAACVLLAGCGKVALYSNLKEKEVNEMMAILLSRGIDCDKMPGTDTFWTLNVEQDRLADSVDILSTFGYPKDEFSNIGIVFKKTGLVSSPTEERIRFMFALSQTIAETITEIDGVLSARVHVVLPDNDPLKELIEPASAAVFVKYRRGSGVDGLGPQIKRLVTNSIEGLAYDKVSLAFFPSDVNEIRTFSPGETHPGNDPHGFPLRLVLIISMAAILLLVLIGVAIYWYMQNQKTPPSSS